jgi:hypothetical protein
VVEGEGGGISVSGGTTITTTLNLTNSTISENSVFGESRGGGVSTSSPATANVKSTIIALNSADLDSDVSGPFSSAGFNMIGIMGSSTGFTQTTDQTGGSRATRPQA